MCECDEEDGVVKKDRMFVVVNRSPWRAGVSESLFFTWKIPGHQIDHRHLFNLCLREMVHAIEWLPESRE